MTATPRRRVLLIDDDLHLLETARRLLEQWGFEVETFSGAFDRLNFIVRTQPDLILLDVNMPLLPGDELLRLFPAVPALRKIPVVFFSSGDEQTLRHLVRETGAAGYIPKSDLARGFAARVARHLEAHAGTTC